MTLDDIQPGGSCLVEAVKAGGSLGRRLMDLGFHPGVVVTVVRNAPLMDPLELSMFGGLISMRHEEAAQVRVSPND